MSNLIKFGRSYSLQIETNEEKMIDKRLVPTSLTIEPPITVEFEIVRNNQASTNTGTFTIYNLNKTTRNQLFKDSMEMPTFGYRNVQFFAGYKNEGIKMMPRIFNGDVRSALSERSGTEFRTVLECFDAGAQVVSTRVAMPIKKGLDTKTVIKQLASQFGLSEMTIGNFLAPYSKRGQVFIGNAADLLAELTQNKFFIDNGRCVILDDNEVLSGEVTTINSDMGLIGSPRRGRAILEFDMVFEPRIIVGQMLTLESKTVEQFNGTFKVTGVTHRGTISDAVAGECVTTVTCMTGEKAFKVVYGK